MGVTGPEHPTKTPTITRVSETGGAESGALGADAPCEDPDLAAVVTAWSELPEAVRVGILAMVRAAGTSETE